MSCEFPKIEEGILAYWGRANTFKRSVAKNKGKGKNFVYYDGPPFANGLPHYGHFVTSCIKDIIPRYRTMKGDVCERTFGWDCHGLPVEMETEKELGIAGRVNIKKYGIDKFNEACQKSVMKYRGEWQKYIDRQARWVDFENDYKTMNIEYMESVIWAFKSLYDKGLVYEATRVVPYSWKCETQLSNFEIHLDNSYREKRSKSVYVKFKVSNPTDKLKKIAPNVKHFFLVAWTTTPWTLPSNLAVAVGENIDYTVIQKGENGYIVATALAEKIEKILT